MKSLPPTRRAFLKNSTAVVATGALVSQLPFPTVTFGKPDSRKLKIGWVGCGGRGTGAANQALTADSNIELWAAADVFQDKIDKGLESLKQYHPDKLNVPKARQFVGLDAYQKVLESGADVVLLTTSPGFRPLHIKAAVDAGKHIFCEKPMATDAPGVRSVIESVKKAKEKGLSIVDGFVWRYTFSHRDTYKRIHAGEIGDINAIFSSYNTGSVDRYPQWTRENCKTDLEWQLRRWYYFTWLSGDHIVEQAIHSIDKMLWTMNDLPPAKCIGQGGRQVRTQEKYGHIYDHFSVEYQWDSGVRGYHYSRQIDKCAAGVWDQVFGTKASYTGESGRKLHLFRTAAGESKWRWRPEREGDTQNGYQTEHDEMYASIRDGNPINHGDRMIKTTLMAIMGRMAAYTGQEITWEMALNSKEDLFPKNLEWDMKLPVAPTAMPGITPFI